MFYLSDLIKSLFSFRLELPLSWKIFGRSLITSPFKFFYSSCCSLFCFNKCIFSNYFSVLLKCLVGFCFPLRLKLSFTFPHFTIMIHYFLSNYHSLTFLLHSWAFLYNFSQFSFILRFHALHFFKLFLKGWVSLKRSWGFLSWLCWICLSCDLFFSNFVLTCILMALLWKKLFL